MNTRLFRHEKIVGKEDAGERLDTWLTIFPFSDFEPDLAPSRSVIQKWIAGGFVTVNGKITTDKSYSVKVEDKIKLEVEIGDEFPIPPPEPLDIRIVHRDPEFVVIDKPPGINSHPMPNDLTGSVVNFLHHENIPQPLSGNPLRPGIVHRLDKNTSGLMVIACTDRAKATLIETIKRREIERRYIAIVFGEMKIPSGTIEAPIGRHPEDRRKMYVVLTGDGKEARTHYKLLTQYIGFSLVTCKLDTGRTHQIRVHLSHIGFPVAGDSLYGGRRAVDRAFRALNRFDKHDPDFPAIEKGILDIADILTADRVHLLHAAKLSFPHPVTGEIMSFKAEPHDKFKKVMSILESLPHHDIDDNFFMENNGV
ncbi:MAG TPA: RluA family pseudouridine synthase [Firmicutes bacterium]|nr:RluA family pseudouridine synthase [Bacillota bacterium]